MAPLDIIYKEWSSLVLYVYIYSKGVYNSFWLLNNLQFGTIGKIFRYKCIILYDFSSNIIN